MNNSLVKSEIGKKLKAGSSKDSIYLELIESMEDNTLRRMLSSRPTLLLKNRYKILYRMTVFLWVVFVLFEFVGSLEGVFRFDLKVIFALTLSIVMLTQVWKLNGDVILPGIIWQGLAIFNSIRELNGIPASDPDYNMYLIFSSFYITLSLVCIVLMYFLRKKIFNYYSGFSPKKDSEGKFMFQEEDEQMELA